MTERARPPEIRNFLKLLAPAAADIPEHRVYTRGANFSRQVGFTRLGVHHVVLPPHCRSSFPHAESLEEEYIYVLQGEPHLWLDGDLYEMRANDAVAFPPGTGIAHAVINNTDSEVHLFVVGERTKPENRCSFPVNPEIEKTCGIPWPEAPRRPLGAHDGLPQKLSKTPLESSLRLERPDFFRSLSRIESQGVITYPNGSETFSEGRRIGRDLGLQRIGIWHETLPDSVRTSWPHAHQKEEEFVYVLKGTPQVWLDGVAHDLKPGDGVGFAAGTGLSHTILNHSGETVELLVCGESWIKDDRIYYPLHPKRNEECKAENFFWEDHPVRPLGSHPGR